MTLSTSKRKVLLLAGYRGSQYFGLQMDPKKIHNSLPTIENELRKALMQASCVIPSNSEDLGKINWSRSSRTDKGVHAARIAFSAKLEVDESTSQLSGSVQRFPAIVEALNTHLPSDIRVFSCIRVNNGFSARSAGIWREYEYLFPLDLLKSSPANSDLNDDELLKRLNMFLQQLEGCNDFHNFHRMSGREMSRRSSTIRSPSTRSNKACDADSLRTEDEEEEQVVSRDSNDESNAVGSDLQPNESGSRNVYSNWQETPRTKSLLTRSIIYRCRGRLMESGGTKYVKVSILGQHFLLQ